LTHREDAHAKFVDLALELIDAKVCLSGTSRKLRVACHERSHGLGDHVFDHAAHEEQAITKHA